MVGYTIAVHVAEPSSGALVWEHEAELDRVVDGVLTSLYAWAVSAEGRTRVEIVTAGVVSQDAERPVFASYEIAVRVGRSVDERDYDGAFEDTAEIHGFDYTTEVTLDGDSVEEID
jgi:hypothetical protein